MKNNKVEIVEKDGKRYIDGEEVLYEYELNINYTKEIIFFIALSIFYFYMKSKNFDVNIGWWIFVFGGIGIIIDGVIRDVKSIMANKVYLTENYLITENGSKINLDDIYFKYKIYYDYFGGIFSWHEILFFRENKFIFYSKIDEDSEKYKNFINTLVAISGNEDVAKKLPRYIARRKLIQIKGENHVR